MAGSPAAAKAATTLADLATKDRKAKRWLSRLTNPKTFIPKGYRYLLENLPPKQGLLITILFEEDGKLTLRGGDAELAILIKSDERVAREAKSALSNDSLGLIEVIPLGRGAGYRLVLQRERVWNMRVRPPRTCRQRTVGAQTEEDTDQAAAPEPIPVKLTCPAGVSCCPVKELIHIEGVGLTNAYADAPPRAPDPPPPAKPPAAEPNRSWLLTPNFPEVFESINSFIVNELDEISTHDEGYVFAKFSPFWNGVPIAELLKIARRPSVKRKLNSGLLTLAALVPEAVRNHSARVKHARPVEPPIEVKIRVDEHTRKYALEILDDPKASPNEKAAARTLLKEVEEHG